MRDKTMKTIVIGTHGDIGRAACAELADRHEIIKAGRYSGDIRVDITERTSIDDMYRKAGKADAVVSAVGDVHFGPLSNLTEDQFTLGLTQKGHGSGQCRAGRAEDNQ
jgi:NAD(P)-dependent dehydrogenase (short-subunit alcohol dehydrogenase family)